jgi:major membrane immunogen (membrane-anchored lipoprotein)
MLGEKIPMKYLSALFFALLLVSCKSDDKKREDFPDTTQEGEKKSNERLIEKNVNDTTKGDTAASRP